MAGELSLKTPATGLVTLSPANTATDKTITLPATTGTVVIQDGTNTTTVTNLSAASITDSGNLTFTGTGNRILGDFSALTLTNRVSFQTSTTNDSTFIHALPNGTGSSSGFFAYNNSNPTNAGVASLSANVTNVQLASGISGTGTYIPLAFLTGGGERMRITTAGNVGIGTAFPGSKLDIDGGSSTGGFTVGGSIASVRASSMVIDMGDSNRIMALGPDTTTAGTLKFIVASSNASVYTTAATINSSGNFGIGTSSPTAKLDISSGANTEIRITTVANTPGQTNTLRFSSTQGGGTYANGGAYIQSIQGSGIDNYSLAFGTALNSTSATERMRIDNIGNVGIGTLSPSTKLEISGGSVTEVRVTSSGNLTTGSASLVRFGGSNSATSGYIGYGGSASTIDLWNTLGGSITFGTSNLERARINSAGDFLVNTALAGPTGLAVNNSKNISFSESANQSLFTMFRHGGTGDSVVGSGVAYNSGSEGVYTSSTSGAWARTAIAVGYGAIKFFTASEATVAVGSSVTLTKSMTLNGQGNFLIGSDSQVVGGANHRMTLTYPGGGQLYGLGMRALADNTNAVTFGNSSNSLIGSISVTGSTTAYNTSSDYRLKENITPMTGALSKVALLKPVTYTWKADGLAGQGFIAHELQAVVPDAVFGEKDAVDEDGNPRYQGVDTSFLVATLTAAIQELTARLEVLENK